MQLTTTIIQASSFHTAEITKHWEYNKETGS